MSEHDPSLHCLVCDHPRVILECPECNGWYCSGYCDPAVHSATAYTHHVRLYWPHKACRTCGEAASQYCEQCDWYFCATRSCYVDVHGSSGEKKGHSPAIPCYLPASTGHDMVAPACSICDVAPAVKLCGNCRTDAGADDGDADGYFCGDCDNEYHVGSKLSMHERTAVGSRQAVNQTNGAAPATSTNTYTNTTTPAITAALSLGVTAPDAPENVRGGVVSPALCFICEENQSVVFCQVCVADDSTGHYCSECDDEYHHSGKFAGHVRVPVGGSGSDLEVGTTKEDASDPTEQTEQTRHAALLLQQFAEEKMAREASEVMERRRSARFNRIHEQISAKAAVWFILGEKAAEQEVNRNRAADLQEEVDEGEIEAEVEEEGEGNRGLTFTKKGNSKKKRAGLIEHSYTDKPISLDPEYDVDIFSTHGDECAQGFKLTTKNVQQCLKCHDERREEEALRPAAEAGVEEKDRLWKENLAKKFANQRKSATGAESFMAVFKIQDRERKKKEEAEKEQQRRKEEQEKEEEKKKKEKEEKEEQRRKEEEEKVAEKKKKDEEERKQQRRKKEEEEKEAEMEQQRRKEEQEKEAEQKKKEKEEKYRKEKEQMDKESETETETEKRQQGEQAIVRAAEKAKEKPEMVALHLQVEAAAATAAKEAHEALTKAVVLEEEAARQLEAEETAGRERELRQRKSASRVVSLIRGKKAAVAAVTLFRKSADFPALTSAMYGNLDCANAEKMCRYDTVEGVGLFFDQLQNDPVKRAAYLRPYGKNKSTLLFGACWNKRADIAQLLIDLKADVDVRNLRQNSAGCMALEQNDTATIKVLVQAGASITDDDVKEVVKRTKVVLDKSLLEALKNPENGSRRREEERMQAELARAEEERVLFECHRREEERKKKLAEEQVLATSAVVLARASSSRGGGGPEQRGEKEEEEENMKKLPLDVRCHVCKVLPAHFVCNECLYAELGDDGVDGVDGNIKVPLKACGSCNVQVHSLPETRSHARARIRMRDMCATGDQDRFSETGSAVVDVDVDASSSTGEVNLSADTGVFCGRNVTIGAVSVDACLHACHAERAKTAVIMCVDGKHRMEAEWRVQEATKKYEEERQKEEELERKQAEYEATLKNLEKQRIEEARRLREQEEALRRQQEEMQRVCEERDTERRERGKEMEALRLQQEALDRDRKRCEHELLEQKRLLQLRITTDAREYGKNTDDDNDDQGFIADIVEVPPASPAVVARKQQRPYVDTDGWLKGLRYQPDTEFVLLSQYSTDLKESAMLASMSMAHAVAPVAIPTATGTATEHLQKQQQQHCRPQPPPHSPSAPSVPAHAATYAHSLRRTWKETKALQQTASYVGSARTDRGGDRGGDSGPIGGIIRSSESLYNTLNGSPPPIPSGVSWASYQHPPTQTHLLSSMPMSSPALATVSSVASSSSSLSAASLAAESSLWPSVPPRIHGAGLAHGGDEGQVDDADVDTQDGEDDEDDDYAHGEGVEEDNASSDGSSVEQGGNLNLSAQQRQRLLQKILKRYRRPPSQSHRAMRNGYSESNGYVQGKSYATNGVDDYNEWRRHDHRVYVHAAPSYPPPPAQSVAQSVGTGYRYAGGRPAFPPPLPPRFSSTEGPIGRDSGSGDDDPDDDDDDGGGGGCGVCDIEADAATGALGRSSGGRKGMTEERMRYATSHQNRGGGIAAGQHENTRPPHPEDMVNHPPFPPTGGEERRRRGGHGRTMGICTRAVPLPNGKTPAFDFVDVFEDLATGMPPQAWEGGRAFEYRHKKRKKPFSFTSEMKKVRKEQAYTHAQQNQGHAIKISHTVGLDLSLPTDKRRVDYMLEQLARRKKQLETHKPLKPRATLSVKAEADLMHGGWPFQPKAFGKNHSASFAAKDGFLAPTLSRPPPTPFR